jgi:predicted dehydrogenase
MARLSLIQVGAGHWGRSWAELIAGAPGFRLAALVDASPATREWATSTLGVPVFPRLERALAAVDSDAVLVASPPSTHRELAEQALEAGRHVVVEKPLALALEDAVAVADAATRAGRLAVAAQNYRFRRQPRALRQLVDAKALGRLLGIRISCRRDLRKAWISPRDWRGKMPYPFLLDMAVHHVDLLRTITRREIAQVDARAWLAPDGPFRHEPTIGALLELDDGTPVHYEGSWAASFGETSWNGDWELVGERGRASWTGGVAEALRGRVVVQRHGAEPEVAELPRLPALDRLGVLHELRRAVSSGTQPECSAADNLRTLAVLFALARSGEERRPVRVEELLPA